MSKSRNQKKLWEKKLLVSLEKARFNRDEKAVQLYARALSALVNE